MYIVDLHILMLTLDDRLKVDRSPDISCYLATIVNLQWVVLYVHTCTYILQLHSPEGAACMNLKDI